jgi:hypothetical protein
MNDSYLNMVKLTMVKTYTTRQIMVELTIVIEHDQIDHG